MLAERADRTIYLRVLAPLLLAVLTLVAVSAGGFHALSGTRAYAGAESLWSKARQQTMTRLRARLTASAANTECAPLSEWLAVPLGDRDARLELDKPDPDFARVRDGIVRSGNSPDDVGAMVQLYLHFGGLPLMRESIEAWHRGDALIEQLRALGERICAQPAGASDPDARAAHLQALDQLDAEFLLAEAAFSASLGRASRQAERLLTTAIALLAVLLVSGSAWYVTRSLAAQLAQRRALLEANTRWELAAEAAGVGVFVWQPGDDRLELDVRARLLYGLNPSAPATMSRIDVASRVHSDDRAGVDELTRLAAAGQPLRARYRIQMADGAIRHLEVVGTLRNAAVPFEQRQMFGVLRDVTDEVLAAQLQLEKSAAERVARAHTEFLSRLSHELRTPLNAVLGLAQVLEVDILEPLSPQQRQRVELILQSGWHLLHLVDDVLDITSIDAGMLAVRLVATDLRKVLQASLTSIEPQRASADVHIVDHWPLEPARVMADPQRLQQVFVNLLSNACKYNRRGGAVTLGYRDSAHEVSVTIIDEGRGIAAEDLPELFKPFKRLAATADVPGTGLGLVVVKRLVEQMSGRVEVNSTPGQGACFMVWLPKA